MFLKRNKFLVWQNIHDKYVLIKIQLKIAIINGLAMEFISLHFAQKTC